MMKNPIKKSEDDIVFVKQTPAHPRDRLKKLAAIRKKSEEE